MKENKLMSTRRTKPQSTPTETIEEAREAIIESLTESTTQMELPMESAAQANMNAPKQNTIQPAQPQQELLSVSGQASTLNLLGDVAFMFTRATSGMNIEANITPDKNGFYAFSFKASR